MQILYSSWLKLEGPERLTDKYEFKLGNASFTYQCHLEGEVRHLGKDLCELCN